VEVGAGGNFMPIGPPVESQTCRRSGAGPADYAGTAPKQAGRRLTGWVIELPPAPYSPIPRG